jgi:cytochrome c biogenesis protein CcmG, thiol:disulfide interchange protein DsbE
VRADTRKRGGLLLGGLALAIIVALGIGAVVNSGDDSTPKDGRKPATVDPNATGSGKQAPAFDLAKLTGPGRVRLSDYKGRPLVLNFWASWCVPCREEFPRLKALVAKPSSKREDLAVVGITYRDIPEDARSFAKDQGATWTLAKGGDGDPVARDYGIRAVPQLYFIDREGVIRKRLFGGPSSEQIDAAVAEITAPAKSAKTAKTTSTTAAR